LILEFVLVDEDSEKELLLASTPRGEATVDALPT
jgi:hypothetical protein